MKPALFSTPMVTALLNTKPGVWPAEPVKPDKPFKSMTRRIIPHLNPDGFYFLDDGKLILKWRGDIGQVWEEETIGKPKYNPGDILWVRETWGIGIQLAGGVIYKADYAPTQKAPLCEGYTWRPSIFMPRDAARLFLEVKNVRCEQLQDITEEDAKAEGVPIPCMAGHIICQETLPNQDHGCAFTARNVFRCLWDSLNAKRGYSWKSNPYVYVYGFMRLDPAMLKEQAA